MTKTRLKKTFQINHEKLSFNFQKNVPLLSLMFCLVYNYNQYFLQNLSKNSFKISIILIHNFTSIKVLKIDSRNELCVEF